MIRLYRAEWSTNCERVGLALAHKRLEIESVLISYSDRSPVEAISGQGLVPVIDDGGTVVADSTAILRHLEERHPEPALWPLDEAARKEVDEFIAWFNADWKGVANGLESELERDDPDAAEIERLSAALQQHLGRFEGMLAGERDFLMGATVGVADFIAYPFLKYAHVRDPADTEPFHVMLAEHQHLGDDHPRLRAWIERVGALPRAY
jgi:glutathione S-transferase